MRYMSAEDRLDAEDARLRDAVVEAALAWRKVYRRYDGGERGWPIVGDLDDAKDALDSAADALLAFLGQGEAAK